MKKNRNRLFVTVQLLDNAKRIAVKTNKIFSAVTATD